MRSTLLAFTLAASALLPAAAGAECLPSPHAVREAHGISAWSTYRTVNGRKCWMEGERPTARHIRQAARTPASRQRPHLAPLPYPIPPQEQPHWPETTQETRTPQALINRAFAAWEVR